MNTCLTTVAFCNLRGCIQIETQVFPGITLVITVFKCMVLGTLLLLNYHFCYKKTTTATVTNAIIVAKIRSSI